MASEDYGKALKLGKKDVAARTAKGEYPYLKALDEIPEAANSIMEYPLGLVQIPTSRIVGTKTAGRSQAFAGNFMPILSDNTEFAIKWSALCDSHLQEGIREPVKAYEFMNRFYILEGNKRVSVLKYFDAVSVPGEVTRIVPARTEEKENKIYYEFMDFYNLSGVNYLWFSEEGRYSRLQRYVGKRPDELWNDEDKKTFSAAYFSFRGVYKAKGGDKIKITTGDAFLEFVEIHGYEAIQEMTTAELKDTVVKSWKVFDAMEGGEAVDIKMAPSEGKAPLLQRLIPLSSPVLKIAFIYEVDPQKSGWTYAHDLGRMHLEQAFPDQVKITTYSMTDYKDGELVIECAIEDGNMIIFTTSPVLYNASLKVAILHPEVKILNCSMMASHGMIRTYSARMYEAKFLVGAIAGAMAENNRLGYIADYPIYGTVANVNAFALGAKMVNPRVKVYVEWYSKKDTDIYKNFHENQVSYVSGRNIIIPGSNTGSRHFGLFDLEEETPHNLAMPVWHWGKFYEKMIRNILSGTWKNDGNSKTKSVNYWWGMSSGVIDVICSQNLPIGTARLVDLLKKTICEGEFNPFAGILYSQDGVIQEDKEATLQAERIITMDWLAENVIGSIPKMSDLAERAKPVVLQQGIEKTEE